MIYSLEQKQGDEWVNVAYAEFSNYDQASTEAFMLAAVNNIPWDDMRIRNVNEIPVDQLQLCECGFPVVFTSETNKVFCSRCEEDFTREDL